VFRSPDPLAIRIALVRNATLGTSTTEQHLDALIICLLDQVRTIAAERVRGYRKTLDAEQYRPIYEGLRKMMSHDGGDALEQTTESAG